MGVVRMTGVETYAQMGEAEKHPRGAMTRQAVHLQRRQLGAAATAPFAPPDERGLASRHA
jgi:hypothetical protein